MKLPVSWLKKYIDVTVSAERLAECLTLSGTKVEQVENKNGESVLTLEITTNRPDCLSLMGLAYEVSAITGKKVKQPAAYSAKEKRSKAQRSTLSVVIEDKKGCPRYTGRMIENVKVAPSPAEIEKLLSLTGTRAICNVVDATNYVLFECGQPLHAFDRDKIKGDRIIVRRSRKGEKFHALDGNEYTLDDTTLIIADAERPIAIAGVIGGKLTEVTSETRNVFLESANFDPALVRQASKKYKLSTESSYRFERSVTIKNTTHASRRAAQLIHEWAGGDETSGLIDKNYSKTSKTKPVTLRLENIEKFLGLKVSQGRVSNILQSLFFSVKKTGMVFQVTPPAFRRDIAIEADLLEEVLRVEGFDKAPETLPVGRYQKTRFSDKKAECLPELKKYMAHLGFQEIMTYSLLSEKVLATSGFDLAQCHAVANAVSAEQSYFRPSLMPGMLKAIQFNAHRKAATLKFFEIGNCYVHGREETRLAIALFGKFEENWRRKTESSFYDLKGVVENVMDFLVPHGRTGSGLAVDIKEVSEGLLRKWDIPRSVFFAEIKLDELMAPAQGIKVRPVPKFPSVRRDIALVVDTHVMVQDLQEVIRLAGSPFLKEVTLFDQYLGKNIPMGKRSLAFSVDYQKENGTFTEEEIQTLQRKVGEALKNKFQVEFR